MERIITTVNDLKTFSEFKFNKKDLHSYIVLSIWKPKNSENIIISYVPKKAIVSNESMMHYNTKKYIVVKY